jgi:hypothetical protein
MKVRELIDRLQQTDPDALVYLIIEKAQSEDNYLRRVEYTAGVFPTVNLVNTTYEGWL